MPSPTDLRRTTHKLLRLLPKHASHAGSPSPRAVNFTHDVRPQSTIGITSDSVSKFPENPYVRPKKHLLVARQEISVALHKSTKRSAQQPLNCPTLDEIAMLRDEDVAEEEDELWFTLMPMVDLLNSETDGEAKRILQTHGFDCLAVISICTSNNSLSLHNLYAYSAVRDETLALADDTLDNIRKSSG